MPNRLKKSQPEPKPRAILLHSRKSTPLFTNYNSTQQSDSYRQALWVYHEIIVSIVHTVCSSRNMLKLILAYYLVPVP